MDKEHECENLIRANKDLVFRTLARLTGDPGRLEDMAQEVFLRFWRAYGAFRGEATASTYIYRIAVNVAKDEWARQRKERQTDSLTDSQSNWEDRLEDPSERADAHNEKRDLWKTLEKAMRELPETERLVLVLYHQEERAYQEIAAILRLPIGTVRTHLHRGRLRLKEKFRERK